VHNRKCRVLVVCPGRITSSDIRILIPFERLAENGEIEYRIEYLQELRADAVHWADIVLIQKINAPKGLDIIEEARLYGKPIIYEIDDNLVDPLPPYHPVYSYYCKPVRNQVERYIRKADIVTVSTEALKERFDEFNGIVRVIPNTIDFRFVTTSKNKTGRLRIGYSGTKTHKGDFEAVLPALTRLAREYRDRISLVFLGYLPQELQGIEGVEEWQYTYEYSEYLRRLGGLGIDISIAPLKDNVFNRYKSNIKYVEYAASGIAGVYSRCTAYADSVTDGFTGILVDHHEEGWYQAIKTLLDDSLKRKRIAAEAYKDIKRRFTIHRTCEDWRKVFSESLERTPKRKKAERRAAGSEIKKIFYIGAGFLWPHTYIDEFLVSAFSSLAKEVAFYPIAPPPFHEQTLTLHSHFDPEYRKYTLSGAITTDKLLRSIRREKPDLIFCVQGYMIPRDILYEISRCGVPSAVWFMDEPYEVARSVDIGSFFTHVFLQDSSTVMYHREKGNPNSHYLPHGFDNRETHLRVMNQEYEYDISLVGTGFPKRRQIIRSILGEGSILVVGGNWDDFVSQDGLERMDTCSLQEAADIYRRSRINLNIHRDEEDHSTSAYPKAAVSPNGSLFYIAGCGGFQIVDDARKEIEGLFEPNKEVVLCHDQDSFREKVEFYLKHDNEREKIAAASYRRAVSEHTYAHRLEKMLEIVQGRAIKKEPHFYTNTLFFPFRKAEKGPFGNGDSQVITVNEVQEGAKCIYVGEETDASTVLNAACFEASSPYTVISSSSEDRLKFQYTKAMHHFSTTPDLGAVVFEGEGNRITSVVLCNRILWRTGAFKEGYRNIELAIRDILLRMKEWPYGVRTVKDSGKPLTDSIKLTAANQMEDQARFLKAWGENPENRIRSRKLIKLSYDLKKSEGEEVAYGLLKKALEMDPAYPDASREMGTFLLQKGSVNEASLCLEKAWRNDEENVATGIMYSLCLITRKREREALGILEQLTERSEGTQTMASIYFNIGRCYKRLGENEEAIRHFEQALQIDPNYLQALKEMFALYMGNHDYRAALNCTEKMAKLQPNSAEVANDMGVLLYTLGRAREALEVLKGAVKLDTNHKEAVTNLKQVAESLGIPIDKEIKQRAATAGT
jgi:spore maturation protein CgeB/Tfp pilus assembly protein PilF